MNVNWNSAASAALWANVKPAETTGAVANKNNDQLLKPHNAETTGAVAFENGTYSSCQDGHFQAAA